MRSEAQPLIEFFSLKRDLEVREFEQFIGEDLRLTISGVGGVRTASILSYVISQEKDVSSSFYLLIGVCGSRSNTVELGEAFLINKAKQNETRKVFFPDILFNHNLKEGGIESFNYVVEKKLFEDTSYANKWEGTPEELIMNDLVLVDMEAAYFFEAGQIFLPPHRVHCLKIVSDFLDIGMVTKDYISRLISENMPLVENVVGNLLDFSKYLNEDFIRQEEWQVVEQISKNLNLTHYMRKEFVELYKIAKAKGKITEEDLLPYLNCVARSKNERKRLYTEIKSKLL